MEWVGGSSGCVGDRTLKNAAHDIFIVGLRNAHAMETVALQLLERQSGRLNDYPEVNEQIRRHLHETKEQIRRLDVCLAACGVTATTVDDAALSIIAATTAAPLAMAGHEILMQTFANHAFENFEIAAYRSLIALCEESGNGDCRPLLEQSVAEEERIADWIGRNIERVTAQSVMRRSASLQSAAPNAQAPHGYGRTT